MPEPAIDGYEPEPAFATLEVDSATVPGSMGSALIETRGVTVCLEDDIGATRIDESAVNGRIAAVWADGPGSATLVRLLAVGSARPDIAVTRASETMLRAVAVFVGRAVRGAAHRHYRPAAGSGR